MDAVNIKLYDIFRKDLHLSDAKAKELVETIQENARQEISPIVDGLATKIFVQKEISDLKVEIEKGFKEQARWMLGVCLTLALMILGIYAAIFLKK